MEARGSATSSWHFIPGQHWWRGSLLRRYCYQHLPNCCHFWKQQYHTSMDIAELQTNANKALNDLLSNKGSIDARRQRAVWDLGMMLHQNESQVATTVKEARVIHSQMALDIWTACSQLILEVRTCYLVAVKEAKTTRSHLPQEAEVTCSKAICEAKAWKSFRLQCFIRSMANTCKT